MGVTNVQCAGTHPQSTVAEPNPRNDVHVVRGTWRRQCPRWGLFSFKVSNREAEVPKAASLLLRHHSPDQRRPAIDLALRELRDLCRRHGLDLDAVELD